MAVTPGADSWLALLVPVAVFVLPLIVVAAIAEAVQAWLRPPS